MSTFMMIKINLSKIVYIGIFLFKRIRLYFRLLPTSECLKRIKVSKTSEILYFNMVKTWDKSKYSVILKCK